MKRENAGVVAFNWFWPGLHGGALVLIDAAIMQRISGACMGAIIFLRQPAAIDNYQACTYNSL